VGGSSRRNTDFDMIVLGGWKISAFLALLISVFLFLLLPLITNPIFKPLIVFFKPIGIVAIVFLSIISVYKFFIGNVVEKSKHLVIANKNKFTDETTVVDPVIGKPTSALDEKPFVWTARLIQDIEWKRFEELVTAFYLEKGIRAEATSLGADGGIDIKLYQDNSSTPTSLVQCKSWHNKDVGVKEIREFLGVLTHEKVAKGFYITTSDFSKAAKETAKANKINLISGDMFLSMILRLPEQSQKRLLFSAVAGDYKTPSCPACGVKMARRKGKRGDFWGCTNYPKCRQMMHIRKFA
jgi:restriction system protein